jgi:hypothetical protein
MLESRCISLLSGCGASSQLSELPAKTLERSFYRAKQMYISGRAGLDINLLAPATTHPDLVWQISVAH